jgi:hypothetical protein
MQQKILTAAAAVLVVVPYNYCLVDRVNRYISIVSLYLNGTFVCWQKFTRSTCATNNYHTVLAVQVADLILLLGWQLIERTNIMYWGGGPARLVILIHEQYWCPLPQYNLYMQTFLVVFPELLVG